MSEKRIKYITYNDIIGGVRKPNPAAKAVVDYVSNTLVESGFKVEMLSLLPIVDDNYHEREIYEINPNLVVKFRKSFPKGKNTKGLSRLVNLIRNRVEVYEFLKENINEHDVVIVYHSVAVVDALQRLKKEIEFTLIIQVAEVYSNVDVNEKKIAKEYRFFSIADGFIFQCDSLRKVINTANKPSVICSGTYEVKEILETPYNDGKIHVVYAGTFRLAKGGAIAAVQSAEYLNEKYVLHIIGYGKEHEVAAVINEIDLIRQKAICEIKYDGLKKGEEYSRYIQKCHIGLSTQKDKDSFNSTSFPSKILGYMANGLRVVSVKTEAISESCVGEYLYYCKECSPKAIAESIQKIDIEEAYDARAIIASVDREFSTNIVSMIDGFLSP